MKLPTIIAGMLGFIGDFLNPLFNTLAWSVMLIIPCTFLVWVLHGRKPDSQVRARALLLGLTSALTFSIILLANILTGIVTGSPDQQNGPPDKSFIASLITPIGALQQNMLETMQSIDTKVEEIRDSSLRQEESLSRIERNTEESTETIRNVDSNMDLTVALSLLDRAMVARDGSMQGQSDALQSLLEKGYEYENVDFSGVNFKRASLNGINMKDAKLHWSDFSETSLKAAMLDGADLRFANIEGAVLDNASAKQAHIPFLNAQNASFKHSDLSQTIFTAANLKNADFSGAQLQGTVFAYADLRGANFTGANLTGAYLIGAILDNAVFDKAIFDNTDMRAANTTGHDLTEQQLKGVCQHFEYGHKNEHINWDIRLKERYPSDRFSSGYEYSDLYTQNDVFLAHSASLPACTTPSDSTFNFNSDWVGEKNMKLERAYLAKAGRKEATKTRVNNHLELLRHHINSARFFRRDNPDAKQWSAYVGDAKSRIKPVGDPVIDDGFFLLHLLKKGLVSISDVDWTEAYVARYYFEKRHQKISSEDFKDHSYWQRFFPIGAPLQDLPESTVDAFKKWTQERVKHLPSTFYLHGFIRKNDLRNRRGRDLHFSLRKMDVRDRSGSWYSLSKSSKELEKQTSLPANRTISLSHTLKAIPHVKYGYIAAMQDLNKFSITISQTEPAETGLWVRVEMQIEDIQIPSPEAAVITASPLNIALMPDKEAAGSWKTVPFNKVE